MVHIRPERYPSGHFDSPTDPFFEPIHEPTIDHPTTSNITPAPLPISPAPKEHIDAILDEQIISTRDGGVQRFLVRWSGRPASDDTWITNDDLQQIDRDLFDNTFEHEKAVNMEKVEQMQAMDKNLVGMARELEKLCDEVVNSEKRALAPNPYGGPYMHPDPLYAPHVHGSGTYVESYGGPYSQNGVGVPREGMIRYGRGAPAPTAGGPSVWGGAYDATLPRR
ncbi:hypothetical protein Acr_10g0009900 [Actinidia rufa]|uniref:Chromo domain-containing protein n=1 Tax=Actinidia rufa TaxID=165716 RepID=A0A7J0FAC1_9ERIC|nr:hypothetical protein Acr_10g0009900 [Actinidia rufa]